MPASKQSIFFAIALIALTAVMPQLLLVILPAAAIMVMLNKLTPPLRLQKARIPVRANREHHYNRSRRNPY